MARSRSGLGACFALLIVLLPVQAAPAQDWQAAWANTLAAARQEGAVTVCIPADRLRREFLLRQWQADYPDIALSLSTVSGTSFVPGVVTERAAGKFLWDVFESGPGSGLSAAKAGLLDPLLPELILPDVSDPAIWGGWDEAFYDGDKKYVLGLASVILSPYYNAKQIPPERARGDGLQLLLDPAYKGKIAWFDPRIEGPGSVYLALFDRVLGADALRRLVVEQQPVFVANRTEVASAIVRGKAVIGISGSAKADFQEFKEAGLALDMRPIGNTPETAWRGADGTTLAVFNRRPHPNAARLFVNWIMTRRIGELMSRAQTYDSRRADVPPLDPDFAIIPGAAYIDAQRDENDALARRWMAEIRRLRPQ
jgi:ABC-type Fe3+ transport system substrate-binding protein